MQLLTLEIIMYKYILYRIGRSIMVPICVEGSTLDYCVMVRLGAQGSSGGTRLVMIIFFCSVSFKFRTTRSERRQILATSYPFCQQQYAGLQMKL